MGLQWVERSRDMTIGEPVVEAGHDVPERRSGVHPQQSDPRSPAPFDALDELGERIATLAAQISAATYELLIMLRDFDERGGWNRGFRSCAEWLGWRLGVHAGGGGREGGRGPGARHPAA